MVEKDVLDSLMAGAQYDGRRKSALRLWSGWIALALVVLVVSVSACGVGTAGPTTPSATGKQTAAGGKKLAVVATTTIIGDLARNVAGDAAIVETLLPYGADPHTFEPSPKDSQTLAGADVLLENGVGLEEWLAQLIKNSGTQAKAIVVSQGLRLREGGEDTEHSATPAAKDNHSHSDDPHLWLDVQNALQYVANIRDALSAADPANAAVYRANAEAYLAQLKDLDGYVVQQAAVLPTERRKLVTSHDTLGYFAARYGFEVVGTVIPSVSAEAQPSAKDVAQLVDLIKREGAPAIFTESTVNPRLAQQIAQDAGVKVVTDLYTDSLSRPGQPADTYVKMMRYNIDQIVKALK